jgi:hypothetical protein
MYVRDMTSHELIRTFEVCVSRNLGSERLFMHYFLDQIERHVLRYDVDLYSRMIRAMAEKNFVEDYVFWEKFAFKYVFLNPATGLERVFSEMEAKQLWDSFVLLKLKCPVLDIKDVLVQLEKFMPKERIGE